MNKGVGGLSHLENETDEGWEGSCIKTERNEEAGVPVTQISWECSKTRQSISAFLGTLKTLQLSV